LKRKIVIKAVAQGVKQLDYATNKKGNPKVAFLFRDAKAH
jgi:hypothetical protein